MSERRSEAVTSARIVGIPHAGTPHPTKWGKRGASHRRSQSRPRCYQLQLPGDPLISTHPKLYHPELGRAREGRAGAGGQGAVTVPQMGAPSHIVFHSQGPGDREGRGRGAREGGGGGGPGGRVFRFMGSVETVTPINAFFQSLRLPVSTSVSIWVSGAQTPGHWWCLPSFTSAFPFLFGRFGIDLFTEVAPDWLKLLGIARFPL